MAVEPEPMLVLRPEYDEWRLINEHPEIYDAILVKDAYTAPYLEGHPHRERDAGHLTKAIPAGRELWRDPDTAGLVSRSSLRLAPSARLRGTALAREFGLPLDLAMFMQNPVLRDRAVDLVLEGQSDSATLIPPYFDVDRRDGPALQLNLQMLRRVISVAGDEIPTAVLQMTRNRLMIGLMEVVADDYARVGIQRVLLRVRGFESQNAERDELIAYLSVIDAFEQRGVEAILDCVGRIGPVFVAAGARGFSTGTRFFKKVSPTLLSVGGGGGGRPIGVQTAGSWEERPREPELDAFDARVATLQSLREHMMLAASNPDALIESLRQGGQHPAIWAGVLAERRRRAA